MASTNPFDPGYYTTPELRAFPFARVGENSAIARNCVIVGLENITIGDNVRIDAFTSIIAARGRLKIGSHVHIGIGCVLGARGGIELCDFSSLSAGVRLLSAIDEYDGRAMTNSTLPESVLRVHAAPIRIGRYVPVGTGSLILPGVEAGEGAAVGAMSLVNRSLEEWTIYSGNPALPTGPRSRDLLQLEAVLAGQGDDEMGQA
ncbi:MAG TPA: acyltransferase [Allosphingosinicella sp.]|nr:acyltransferase [Allosphingosinicella sp.]